MPELDTPACTLGAHHGERNAAQSRVILADRRAREAAAMLSWLETPQAGGDALAVLSSVFVISMPGVRLLSGQIRSTSGNL
ncbi:Uu.00g092450.m01.CDS01 [Anthostomella pinea]|uniref:Uu.00g092450.m01.CDS01 n=1 Tax=Anthostomella pinea TaxID=933095 RepID=A0AAI8VNB0_9PEZI|nr:Uu.00g092450.m01.CDS01 [Anthostomella pinea]